MLLFFLHNPCNIVEYVVLDGGYHTHLRHGIRFTPHGRNHIGSQMRRRGGMDPLPCISPFYIYSSVKEKVERV